METKKRNTLVPKFGCEICNFKCCTTCDFNRHLLTPKHINNSMETQNTQKAYTCNCGRKYINRSGLWKHTQKCFIKPSNDTDKDIILGLLQQNSSLQNQIIEMAKEKNVVTNYNNNHNNSHNKTFNLNMFLNEQCKDAMNLTDFVDSLQFQLSDLEKVGELGYVAGLSNMIIRNLKALDVFKRPIHCSDAKRETVFIKQADKWEKENDNKEQLNKAIKTIANKNIRMIPKWREKYPECGSSDSCKSDQYNNIIIQSLDTNPNSNPKIISNIAKEVKIDKEKDSLIL